MRISTFIYSIRQGIKNIWRNKMFSLASIATMAACIFLFGLFFAIVTNFQSMVRAAEEGVAVTVLFDDDVTPQEIAEIGDKIKVRTEVSAYNFKSAADAWEEFSQIYFEGNEDLAEGFGDDNPLQKSESYEIYLSNVSEQETLVTYLESLDGVREVRRSEIVANTLSDFNRLIGYVSAGIILILLCVAVFLISNTVTVGIAVRKEEIAIMKLIGATDYLVRAPFVVEGILIGLIGSALPLILLYGMYSKLIGYIMEKFNFLSSLLTFLPANTVFRALTPVALVLGVGIGFLGSFVTIRKHLKV
ncbi:permease-like cell division protein FtsX [Lachnospiraceae bacterium 47-T17]